MSRISVPHPPQSSRSDAPLSAPSSFAPRPAALMAALDWTFLRRCLVSTALVGAAFSVAIYAWLRSPFIALSYFGGALFGALLVATLMSFVLRLSASKTGVPYRGVDAIIPIWLLALVKYFGIAILAWGVATQGWANPFAFVLGVALVQLIIVLKTLGRKFASDGIAEVYIKNAR